jgi:hypothetical protein
LSKIILEVEDKNIDTVLLILHNLKQGLVKNISSDKRNINTSIQAKKALKKQVVEDEFMSAAPSSGKYLSRSAFKNKLARK